MFGLILSAPDAMHEELDALLAAHDIPLSGFTDAPSPILSTSTQNEFLHAAADALLRPGTSLPADAVLDCLRGDARPGNVLRRLICLQLSLLPYLRVHHAVTELAGGHLIGDCLLAAVPDAEDRVDCLLPDGAWTDLMTGEVHTGKLRCLRSLSAVPILVRENTLLPIGVDDRHTDHDDADHLTLHWYQPQGSAACTLADGTAYSVQMDNGLIHFESASTKPYHLIVHQDGSETLVH